VKLRALGLLALALAVVGGAGRAVARARQDRFDHWEHRALFPTCLGCHAGAEDASRSLWPRSSDCTVCHDGTIEKTVEWSPPVAPRASNLRFTHPSHAQKVAQAHGADSTLRCSACHAERGADPMRVQSTVVQNCLGCHAIRTAHLEAPDSTCATCHLPLVQAVRLTRTRVGDFPAPQSHRDPEFASKGHGKLARTGGAPVAASCATCHARDYCTECHVNAPEVPAIQALGPDPRSLAHKAELEAPPDHADARFIRRHGGQARKEAAKCAVCHTQESCVACHIGSPASVQAIPAAGPGRGRGATIHRERPTSHGLDFSELHAEPASARPQSCSGCHARPECLSCHRPDAAEAVPGYHPAGFLARHPVAAYTRESSCSDCHNPGQFCANCHLNAGLASPGRLRGAGYHDAKQFFLLNHGQAARQNLESCVSCHSERDCLTCHSAAGGRRFNPHGPGFDPATLRRKNPSMCTACHESAIPER
jgi:Doubled CXXCH motif (Paired_CXXCH_1)